MVSEIFLSLSLVIALAVVVSVVMRILKQPLIIGYIITGIIVGPYFLDLVLEQSTVGTFSQIGVALLLFTVGLHLNPKVIKEVGKASLVTGIGQVIFTSVIGYLIGIALGFSWLTSLYIAIALTFSSTIIIMKLLSDKGDVDTIYGKISIGFLIVQDLIAVVILMAVSSFSTGTDLSGLLVKTFIYGIVAIVVLGLFSFTILPLFMRRIAKSQEFLFLFSVGWCLILAALFKYLNFSLEIGALLAGITLSITPYANDISSKMKPLRDFFIIIFFIVIGSQMVIGDIQMNLIPIIIFSAFILVGNPLIVMVLMGGLNYTKRTGFMAGLTVAQISEFSLILVALGVSVGHLSSEVLSLVTVVGLITIAGSTYLITYSNKIYPYISKYLNLFERKRPKKDFSSNSKAPKVILFGHNRIGFGILNTLKKMKKSYLVVDYNPDMVEDLKKMRVPVLYGDVYDSEFLEELPLSKIELAISTIPDVETNKLLIEKIRQVNKDAVVIVRAHQIEDAFAFYEMGASYVLTPHFIGGDYISRMIKDLKINHEDYKGEKNKHVKFLKDMLSRGHQHPKVEKG